MIDFINNSHYKLLNIANYNDIDYYLISDNDNYKYYYEENNEVIELIDTTILEKLNMLFQLLIKGF